MNPAHNKFPDPFAQVALDGGMFQLVSRGGEGSPVATNNATGGMVITDAPASGQKLVITDLILSVDTAMAVTLKEQDTGAVIRGPLYLAANTTLQLTTRGATKLPTADKALVLFASVPGNVSAEAIYFSEE